ncbi:DUF4393 domain-containing protein [Pseudomonas sichuanensis]|uniref:DUF4393 domain-containing protein n=1 Tax=Pseudomonas sichuanensis TaxID=2213015 RepID=UPI0038145E9C
MSEDNKVKETVEAVTGLVQAIPIYQDLAQPAVKQVGKALETIGKAINLALAPVGALVWGYEKCQDFISTKVADRLKEVPPEDIITPKPNVAGPAIEALRYTGHEEQLSDLYANLLASAMDKKTASGAHPAFVEIIKQLTPDEAKVVTLFRGVRAFPLLNVRESHKDDPEQKKGGRDVLSHFSLLGEEAGVEFVSMVPAYLDNLCRLGLIEYLPAGIVYTAANSYEPLETHATVLAVKQSIEVNPVMECEMHRTGFRITELGKQFAKICVHRA